MSGDLLVWNGEFGLGPYLVGEIIDPSLIPSDSPSESHFGVIWTDLEDEGLTLVTDSGRLIGLTSWREFWVEGTNLIGEDAEVTCARYFGGIRECQLALPFRGLATKRTGIDVLAEGNTIRRITLERFDSMEG